MLIRKERKKGKKAFSTVSNGCVLGLGRGVIELTEKLY